MTRTFVDEDTGEEPASVYVPTAPNPAGGYLEIVPVSELVPLDWTVDQAMAFVLSGGTTAPDRIRFRRKRSDDPGKLSESKKPSTSENKGLDDGLRPRDQQLSAQTRDA